MPFSYTLDQMIDQIKFEARVSGADNLNIFVTDTINELLLDLCLKNRYRELIKTNVLLVRVDLGASGAYTLPDDYINIKEAYYAATIDTPRRQLRHKNDFVENSRATGEPKYYELAGNTLLVTPGNDLPDDEQVRIDYFSLPNKLTAPTDVLPSIKMFAAIKLEAIKRVHIWNKDYEASDRTGMDAKEEEKQTLTEEENADH